MSVSPTGGDEIFTSPYLKLNASIMTSSDQPSPYVEAYSRFLHLIAAIEKLPGMDAFGTDEKALFEQIMLSWSAKEPLTVRQIIGIERLGSPATLHKRLMRLREMDLVDAAFHGNDRRKKYLSPSAKGLK